MSQFVYDLIYIDAGDGTANLMTLKRMELPIEIKNLCKVLGIDCYRDHLGWTNGDVVAGIVEQCPILGIKVREVSISDFQFFFEKLMIEEALEHALRGADFEKIIQHDS